MIYPNNFEQKLAFDKIRAMVKGATLCPLGAERVEAMQFMTQRAQVEHELALLREMMDLLAHASQPLPTDNFFDLTASLRRVRVAGTFLEAEELWDLRRSLDTIRRLALFLRPEGEEGSGIELRDELTGATTRREFPLLRALTEDVVVFPDLIRRIDQTLSPTGEIRDNASARLAEIRRELAQTVSSISRLLNSILRSAQSEGLVEKDVTPALRDGRLVIPIPPSSKRKLRGIVHDESATGRTLYVEPAEVVENNNRIRELEGEERQEIIRILTSITDQIRPELPDMMASYDFLGAIDFLHAKARFARQIDAIVPEFSTDGSTDWVQARHPLLYLRYKRENELLIAQGATADELHTIVPLDILLDRREQRIVLISGPNAGGKSVCLETLGLLQYMLQCGLALPLKENSRCTIFQDIMVDIGDEQSIENDLSTYSSHLQNMKQFVRQAGKHSLLLIDEFGSGTEPQIGGAIAQALLGKFNDAKANGVITTHFTNLKLFADQTSGIRNGAMLYDRGKMRPLFMLEVGRPGSSFAIEIAHKIGLPLDVIDEAKRIVGSDYVNMDKYLQDISRDKRYWEQKRQKIHQQEKDLEEEQSRLEAKVAEVKQKKNEILQGAREQASSLIQQANARIERTIREIKEVQAEKEATKEIRRKHEAFKERLRPKERREKPTAPPAPWAEAKTSAERPLAVGDNVRLKGQRTVGQILSVSGRQCQVAFGMLRSTVDASRLERVSNQEVRKVAQEDITSGLHDPATDSALRQRRLAFKQEIDVRGMRAEEALQKVMYYIDDAIMLSAGQVRILHGTGTGALRQAIRQYLSTLSGVRDYHDEHVQFGGAGITVVEVE